MASKNLIKIHEVCKVCPNDPHSELSLPLTFLDIVWLHFDPSPLLFFYEFPEPNADSCDTLISKLKKSLSLTLNHYLPVAGHMTWPQDSEYPVIQYIDGDGVSLTIAETQSDFNSLSRDEFHDSAEFFPLLPEFPTSETQTPVITLKITLFPNTGFTIGIALHNGVLDGKSLSLFVQSWAYICKNGDNSILAPELIPSLDRNFVKQQSELERIFPKSYGKPRDPKNKSLTLVDTITCPQNNMIGTFKLTRENIDVLKKSVSIYRKEKFLQDNGERVSTFTIASALAMVCLVKAKNIISEKVYLGINVDARARLEPHISSNYFGNCVVGGSGSGDTKDYLSKDGFKIAVDNVTKVLASFDEGLVNKVAGYYKRKNAIVEEMKVFGVIGSPRMELYKVDFGLGTPKKLELMAIAGSGVFYLSDDRNGNGGVEIGVGLNKHEAEVFTSEWTRNLLMQP